MGFRGSLYRQPEVYECVVKILCAMRRTPHAHPTCRIAAAPTQSMTAQADYTQLEEHLDVPYTVENASNKLREFDFYVPHRHEDIGRRLPPLICFVHGGAWRS